MSDWIINLFGMSYREIWTFTNIFTHLKDIFTGFSFKGFIASVVAICDLLTMLLFSAPVPPRGQELNLDDYQLVFVDEFEQEELDQKMIIRTLSLRLEKRSDFSFLIVF